ncbi:hypothetical protein FA13DRAFT_304575 [Coprinellus micaceus]|uniref:G domain-containing protein n=1 Tax=Coprinellus micaceus TaxID=71717 RepID=A0A4Y7SEI2_COPMI|nr:hypothetical protein FA13DRAFT_304575 [Coprinellus micaceus]
MPRHLSKLRCQYRLIGHGGSGRSTFINDLLPEGAEKMEVSSKLGACTKEVAHTVIDSTSFSDATRRVCSRNFRLVLVDTPGLDVEGQADSAVFQKLSEWSKKWIPESGCKSGVVVLHEVGASRAMDAHDIATLAKSFEIMVGTTKWKYLGGRNGDTHQDQLVKLWAGSLERRQFCMLKQGTHPWTLINTLLPRIEARNKIDFWKTFDAMLPERRKIEVDHDAKREVVKQEVKESLGRMFANAIRRMFGRPPKGKRKDKGQGH